MSPEKLSIPGPRVAGVRSIEVEAGGDAYETLLESVRSRAFEAGVRAGLSRAREQAVRALEQAVVRLDAQRQEMIASGTPLAIELARDITRALLRVELPADRYDLETIVRESLREGATDRARCVVHLNPADAKRIESLAFRAGTEIQPDPDVPRGDVHIETRAGLLVREIDAGLETLVTRLLEESGET